MYSLEYKKTRHYCTTELFGMYTYPIDGKGGGMVSCAPIDLLTHHCTAFNGLFTVQMVYLLGTGVVFGGWGPNVMASLK